MLLSAAVLGGLLVTGPAQAAHAAPRTAAVKVAKVKASPAKTARACPTTVGYSAVVAVKKRGAVRYRWVRSDGSRSAIRTLRVKRAGKMTVRDRQTFDRTTSGWQAVQVIGQKRLSAKARFSVTCQGPAESYNVSHLMAAAPDEPLVAAASVEARPAVHRGACPTTVTFTGTIQVSRTPATVKYQWIDSATGESGPRSVSFAAGEHRSKQVRLHLGVGSSARGWKAIRVLNGGGRDSGRATYAVTCERRPPSPTPTSTPTSTPTGTPAPTSTPTVTPTTQPPARPVAQIVDVTPGTYEGSCAEPLDYRAVGRITLAAGPAQQVTYWWQLDGAAWQQQVVDFPASEQPRSQDVDAAWTADPAVNGAHTLNLVVQGGSGAEQKFTITCTAEPGGADLTIRNMSTSLYRGDCARVTPTIRASALVMTDREAEMRYRFVVDGRPSAVRTQLLKPGVSNAVGHSFQQSTRASGSGTIRLEVLNQDMPVKQIPYTWACQPAESGTVVISEISPVAWYGDCAAGRPYVTAFASMSAANGTEIEYRWIRDGVPDAPIKTTVRSGNLERVQSANWERNSTTGGTIAFEVLNHDRPSVQAAYTITCES